MIGWQAAGWELLLNCAAKQNWDTPDFYGILIAINLQLLRSNETQLCNKALSGNVCQNKERTENKMSAFHCLCNRTRWGVYCRISAAKILSTFLWKELKFFPCEQQLKVCLFCWLYICCNMSLNRKAKQHFLLLMNELKANVYMNQVLLVLWYMQKWRCLLDERQSVLRRSNALTQLALPKDDPDEWKPLTDICILCYYSVITALHFLVSDIKPFIMKINHNKPAF